MWFYAKVLCTAFLQLQFGSVIFGWKNFGAKAAGKMWVKLTAGHRRKKDNLDWL